VEEEKTKKEETEGLFLYEERNDLSGKEGELKPKIILMPFSLADEWYAADIGNILEVISFPSITKVPGLADFMLGITNIRGNIISVTDLKRLFTLANTAVTAKTRVIVINAAQKATGLLVDSVEKVLSVSLDLIQPVLATIPEIKAEYIKGELKLADGRMVTILNLEKVMFSDEMLFE